MPAPSVPGSGGARFQLFTRRRGSVEWRLIGANNWVVGQVGSPWPDLGEAVADIRRVKDQLGAARDEVFVDRAGWWRWEIRLGDQLLAASSRLVRQGGQCQAAVARFHRLAPHAPVDPVLRVFR